MRRIPIVLVTSALALALAATAHGAGYDVYACNPAYGGGANNSFAPVADPDFAAYAVCPPGEGLVARSRVGGSTTGFQGSAMVFDAPDGTTVASIHFYGALHRASCSYGIGVYAGGFDLGGTMIWGFGAEGGSSCYTDFAPSVPFDVGVNAPRVRLDSRCGAATCSTDGDSIKLREVIVHVEDDGGPGIANVRGGLWSTGWFGGTQDIAFDANDASGISDASVQVDGKEILNDRKGCDYTQRSPCPQSGLTTSVQTSAVKPDGRHTVTVVATDAAGNVAQTSQNVGIDNTPPAQPTQLTVVGGEGWRSIDHFDLTWRNPPETGVAPIAGVEYDLCPVSGGQCTRGSVRGANIESLADVHFPAAGQYRLRVWLRDAAGNQDSSTAGPPLTVGYDPTPPDLSFEPLSASDPTLLTADASDRDSGLASGQIELQPQGGSDWRPIDTSLQNGQLVARLDDVDLPDGTYALRARVTDAAGNERTTTTRTDGQPAVVTLPVRLPTKLRVGVVRHRGKGKHRRAVLVPRAKVGYRKTARLRGRLLTGDGNPIADADVLVLAAVQRQGAPFEPVATLKTSRRGEFSYRAPKGVSRAVRFRYTGTPTIRTATADVALNVAARSTFHVSRHHAFNGQTVRFRGRLGGGWVPAEGKLVEMQVRLRQHWRTFATTRTDAAGRWVYDYTFDGTRGRLTYRFRAHVPREATYPFAPGRSRSTTVTVRGQ